MAQLISFAELTGGTETVRCTTIDGKTYMSISYIIMVVCKHDKKQANDTWKDIPDRFKKEVAEFLNLFQFRGQGE